MLSLAVPLGGLLAAGRARSWALAHGALGAAGAVALILALRGGHPSGLFAWDAMALLIGAAAGGLGLATLWRRSRRPALIVFLHASAGGLAYLLLAGFVLGN